jgi:hypothetical protein
MDHALSGAGAVGAYSRKHQSKPTNDLYATPGLDARTTRARLFRDAVRTLVADIGGEGKLTATQRWVLRQAAWCIVALELASSGEEPLTPSERVKEKNALGRLLWQLGIAKRKRTTGLGEPDLAQYLAAKGGAR